MPGQGSYGPGGKWIHDRAQGIMKDSPETPKNVAYAIATQQGHKVGKSPKGFRTAAGVREAKMKYNQPKSEYQKTAMFAGFFDELQKIAGPMLDSALQASGGKMTDAAYAAGRDEWLKQQAAKKNLPTIMQRYARTGGSAAKPAASKAVGLLGRLLRN